MKRKYISNQLLFHVLMFLAAVAMLTVLLASNHDNTDGKKLNLFNLRPVVVVSGSMLPEIQINSLSIMQYCDIDDIDIGEVAVYNHPTLKIMITHRVVDKQTESNFETYLRTKGDANISEDSLEVTEDMFVGKLVATYNWTVPIIENVIKDERIDTMALLIMVIMIACVASIVAAILGFIMVSITSIWLATVSKKQLDCYVEGFDNNITEQKEIKKTMPDLKFHKGDSIRTRIGKLIMIASIRSFGDAQKNLRLAKKIAYGIGGWSKKS